MEFVLNSGLPLPGRVRAALGRSDFASFGVGFFLVQMALLVPLAQFLTTLRSPSRP